MNTDLRQHENIYVRIASLGGSVWNRWLIQGAGKDDIGKLDAEGTNPFSELELREIAKKIGEKELPSPKQPIIFDNAIISADIDFSDFYFLTSSFKGATFNGVTKFNRAKFSREVDFSNTKFNHPAHFYNTHFFDDANFIETEFERGSILEIAQFHKEANFRKAIFLGNIKFADATFMRRAYFSEAIFNGETNFDRSKFTQEVDFSVAKFLGSATFRHVHFHDHTTFVAAIFGDHIEFTNIESRGSITFDGFNKMQFAGMARFTDSKFFGPASFRNRIFSQVSYWTNSEFHSTTSFLGCDFFEPPNFHGAQFHEDTNWTDTAFKQGNETSPQDATRSWRVLRQAMIEIHDYENELRFFAYELRAKQRYVGISRRALYFAYQLLSNYGQSVARPIYALAALSLSALISYGWIGFCWNSCQCQWKHIENQLPELISFTISSGLPFIGQSRLAAELATKLTSKEDMLAWLYIASAFHGILSAIFIFLVLLGIRNRLRIK